jgi:DNA-binding Lrp family transcriptional regulator
MVSGQTRYPISEIITGHSGSGKNESIRAVSPLFPEGWIFEFTTSTPEAIKYIPEDFNGTIIIYELAGIRSETGTLGLRSIGEGKGIKTIYPMRDENTGKMTLGETQTNAKNFISTDSGLDIAADLYRRVFKNSMNDSLALTKRVCAKKMRDGSIPESLRIKLFPEQNKITYSENDFGNALAMTELNLEVIVFPPSNLLSLIDLTNKKEQQVALRTQIERILNVIKILALIHQKQRIKLTIEENSYIIADAQDVELALTILENSIIETVTRIEKRQKEALEIFEKSNSALNKNQLADKLGCSTVTAAKILKTLAKNGYLKEIETSKPFSYELSDEEKNVNPFVLSEKISEYKANYPTELKSFLSKSSYLVTSATPKNGSIEIPERLEEKYSISKKTSEKVPTEQESKLIAESKAIPFVFSERINTKENFHSVTESFAPDFEDKCGPPNSKEHS